MTPAENSAEELVFDLGLTLPIIPSEVCNQLSDSSFPVSYQEELMSSGKFCGISLGDSNGAKILVNSSISTTGRKNFTGAHEIGHVILHIQTGKQSQFECTNNDIYGSQGKNIVFEQEANQFASSLLMPKSLINKFICSSDLNWKLIQELSNKCDSSLEATARRVVEISNDMCALIIHKKGEMWTPIRSPSFTTYINTIPFPNNLGTTPDTPVENVPDYLDECDTIDWITNNSNLPATIYYSAVRNNEYDRTMSLIIVPEIDEDSIWNEPKF